MRKISALVAAFALLVSGANAANIPLTVGPVPAADALATINQLTNNINQLVNPNTMAPFSNFRNYLDNGQFAVYQRGTTAAVGGTNSGGAKYVNADRWAISTNVASGAGFSQVVTTSPTPVIGSAQSMKVYRNSGSLTQPVCAIQEIPTSESQNLQGQAVTLSFYAQALAGLAADNGSVINAYIIYGTGTDQGLGTLTASPAITPAWTGITSSITNSFTINTSWNRYQLSGFIPATTNEVGVEICFTPTAAGSGSATDGFALGQIQLEDGNSASAFEFRPYGIEVAKAQQYFYALTEPASGIVVANGISPNTTTCTLALPLPVTMRTAPVTAGVTFIGTALSTSTFKALPTSTLAAPFLVFGAGSTTTSVTLTATLATATTAGFACQLQGNAGGAIINVSTEF